MKRLSALDGEPRGRTSLHVAWLLLILLAPLTGAGEPIGLRVQNAVGKFTQTRSVAVVYPFEAQRMLGADRVDLTVASLESRFDRASMVSVGPVWHFALARDRAFVELAIAPTLLSHSDFELRDIGGRFHFTSSVSIGRYFGPGHRAAVALHVQHMSNGGIHSANPGFDMAGVSLTFGI